MTLLPYILFEKFISMLALEVASRGNQHCDNCIGTLSFPIERGLFLLGDLLIALMQAKSELEAENAFGERLSLAVLLVFVDSANNLPVYVSYLLALINLYFFTNGAA